MGINTLHSRLSDSSSPSTTLTKFHNQKIPKQPVDVWRVFANVHSQNHKRHPVLKYGGICSFKAITSALYNVCHASLSLNTIFINTLIKMDAHIPHVPCVPLVNNLYGYVSPLACSLPKGLNIKTRDRDNDVHCAFASR
jgi:hypothetical protein